MQRLEEKELKGVQLQAASKRALGSLAQGVVKLSQIVGILPEGERRDLGLAELLDWEGSGQSLAQRLDQAWTPRVTLKAKSVLDVLALKADQSSFKLLQLAIRDLDVRISHLAEAARPQALGCAW